MTQDRNALRAGLFIVITIALIIGVVISIRGIDRLLEERQARLAVFKLADDLGGLKTGDDIRIGGAKVGEVKQITIDPANEQIRVGFVVPRRYTIRQGAILSVQQTVTGGAWLNFQSLGQGDEVPLDRPISGQASAMSQLLSSLGNAAPELQKVLADVRTQTIPRVNTTVDKIGDTATTFKTTGESANTLLRHADEKVEPVVERYNKVADNAAGAMGELRDMLGPTKTDFRGTMANINSATGSIKDKLPGLLEQFKGVLEKTDTAIAKATGALDDIKVSTTHTRDVTASVRSILVGNRSKIDSMISSLKSTGENLKSASSEIRHSPWRLLYQPKKGEVENLNLYDSARQFAEGAGALSEAASALRDTLKDPDADARRVQLLIEKLDQSFAGFVEVEKHLWEQVK